MLGLCTSLKIGCVSALMVNILKLLPHSPAGDFHWGPQPSHTQRTFIGPQYLPWDVLASAPVGLMERGCGDDAVPGLGPGWLTKVGRPKPPTF